MTIHEPETADEAVATDNATAEAEAAERLIGILNDASTGVLASIGYQTGLFETLADFPPASSDQIADAAGLNERYVREWLGGMVTARFIDFDPGAGTYQLRRDIAPFVSGPGVENLARTLTYVTLMGEVTRKIVDKFSTGGGLDYADYPGFVQIQAADSGAVHDSSLLTAILPLSGCLDDLESGIDVADIGCGAGHAVNLMAQAFPASRFVGYDFLPEALAAGRAEAASLGLDNVRFELQDAATLDIVEGLDLVTVFDAVHDQAHPAAVLHNIWRALRPGGTFLMVDIKASSRLEDNVDLPWAAFLYAVSTTHCMSVSLGQGGDGLGTVWGVQRAETMLRDAGFDDVRLRELDEDPFNAYFVSTKQPADRN
jgi:SAM-dependent methyltransferase